MSTDTAQATATVTITLSRDDALWWRNVIDEPHTWSNPGEAQRVLSAVVAALTAAPPPAPSDDDLIGRERALVYRSGEVALYAYPIDFSLLFVQEVNGGRSNRLFVPALYCDAMIDALILGKPERDRQQASLAAGRSAGEGDER